MFINKTTLQYQFLCTSLLDDSTLRPEQYDILLKVVCISILMLSIRRQAITLTNDDSVSLYTLHGIDGSPGASFHVKFQCG